MWATSWYPSAGTAGSPTSIHPCWRYGCSSFICTQSAPYNSAMWMPVTKPPTRPYATPQAVGPHMLHVVLSLQEQVQAAHSMWQRGCSLQPRQKFWQYQTSFPLLLIPLHGLYSHVTDFHISFILPFRFTSHLFQQSLQYSLILSFSSLPPSVEGWWSSSFLTWSVLSLFGKHPPEIFFVYDPHVHYIHSHSYFSRCCLKDILNWGV